MTCIPILSADIGMLGVCKIVDATDAHVSYKSQTDVGETHYRVFVIITDY